MNFGALGKVYGPGEVIFRQGDAGDCMYVIQSGQVEVLKEEKGGRTELVRVMGSGDIFGEMALLEPEARSATVRALGSARILTLDKKTFLRRVHADPSLAYRLLQALSRRIRKLDAELEEVRKQAASGNRPGVAGPAPGGSGG